MKGLSVMDSGSNPSGAVEASGFGEPALHGLKFGKKLYFEVMGGGSSGGSSSSDPEAAAPQAPPTGVLRKKGKGSASGGRGRQPPPPKCQVEGCGEDLTGAKAYYCKHRVCGAHSKSPKVIVAGLEQRFCQQCSRFHQLTEFDQGKRSCRRRLAGHNERRRKPPPVPLASRYGRISSFHGNCLRYGGFLPDFSHPRFPSAPRETWPTVQASHRVTCNHWLTHVDGPPTSAMGAQIVNLYGSGPPDSAGRIIYNQEEVHPSQYHGVTDSICALSLLSNQPRGVSYVCNGSPAILGSHTDAQMAQSSVMNNSWISTWSSFRGPDISFNEHEIPHEMGLGLAAGTGSSNFSGELELDLQGNRKYGNHGDAMAYSPPGNLMHWPL